MSEGEFKKRMEDLLVRTKFEKIVDEAKKEWLDIEEVELPLKVAGRVDWQKTAELMELRNLIRNKWFKKWFGGGYK